MLSPPIVRFAIRLIFVEWLWYKGSFRGKFTGFDDDSKILVGSQLSNWEVKQRLGLLNQHPDHVVIQSELKCLIAGNDVVLKCRVFGGKTGPIAMVRVFVRQRQFQLFWSSSNPNPEPIYLVGSIAKNWSRDYPLKPSINVSSTLSDLVSSKIHWLCNHIVSLQKCLTPFEEILQAKTL